MSKGLDALRAGRRVIYFIAPSMPAGVEDAKARGWTQIAWGRFVTPLNEDVRLICRFNELLPFNGPATLMIKARGYDDGDGALVLDNWLKDMERFEDFTKSGNGQWIEWPPETAEPG